MTYISERQVIKAALIITRETGYPPDAIELALALGCSTRQVQSALTQAKRRGLVRYTGADRLQVFGVDET